MIASLGQKESEGCNHGPQAAEGTEGPQKKQKSPNDRLFPAFMRQETQEIDQTVQPTKRSEPFTLLSLVPPIIHWAVPLHLLPWDRASYIYWKPPVHMPVRFLRVQLEQILLRWPP